MLQQLDILFYREYLDINVLAYPKSRCNRVAIIVIGMYVVGNSIPF